LILERGKFKNQPWLSIRLRALPTGRSDHPRLGASSGRISVFTRLISSILKRSLRPFVFLSGYPREATVETTNLGLYVHIPFCNTLCPFCPYFKERYDPERVAPFVSAIKQEIRFAGAQSGQPAVSSVYYGGGTPYMLSQYLPEIQTEINTSFTVEGPCGIELHPDDIHPDISVELIEAGFDMVSIGIQSFQRHNLRSLGRTPENMADRIALVRDSGFSVVDVDLIFGLPGQSAKDIQQDFRIAAEHGATQISTYPFIDFSYTRNLGKPVGAKRKRELLDAVLEISEEIGFERTSVWTFALKNSGRYSSVTRDSYLGFGPSAASLLRSSFSVNVFSVSEYIRALAQDRSPTALLVELSERERALFWLFWNSYNLIIKRDTFTRLFGNTIENVFGRELRFSRRLGILGRRDNSYMITRKGAYLFHLVEQMYTDQYIDKVWMFSRRTPWPSKLVIH
jgi:coproporphyrinogen III oxidase-like Fe-S oxidoreductase